MNIKYLLLFLVPGLLFAQNSFDITGRVSMRVENISYDEKSDILPDSIDADTYSKTFLVPGLKQSMNLAMFGRSRSMDMTLLADLANNDWNKLDFTDINSVGRLTLNLRFKDQEAVFGDFFESGSELFIQSREIRGLKYSGKFDNSFGPGTFFSFNGMGGLTQKAIKIGDNLQNLFGQYETSGQFMRYVGGATARFGQTGKFDVALSYLYGKDDENSISQSINQALTNNLYGGDFNAYFMDRDLRFFGEFYQSSTDSLEAGSKSDMAARGGVDLRYDTFKIMLFYQYLGYNYFTMGYPFLEKDKNGIRGNAAYIFPRTLSLQTDFESYNNNLDDRLYNPTTYVNRGSFGITTLFPEIPQLSLRFGLRQDKSNTVFDVENNPLRIEKTTTRFESRVSHSFGRHRFSVSGIYLDLNDESLLASGTPLGTDQIIASFNFYSQMADLLFFSGGLVYSTLNLTNNQKNTNIYLYESNRWDIVPRKLKLETNVTVIQNDATGGGYQDYLSDYLHFKGNIALEYFFSDFVSFKILGGTDTRDFKYNRQQALLVIADDAYGPTFFNGNESYQGMILGGELNWNF